MDSARDDAELKALIERLTLLKELENARKLSLGADVTDKGLRLLWAFPSLTALTLSSTNEYRAEGAYESSSAQRGEDLSCADYGQGAQALRRDSEPEVAEHRRIEGYGARN